LHGSRVHDRISIRQLRTEDRVCEISEMVDAAAAVGRN
jgi:hypothetical protein